MKITTKKIVKVLEEKYNYLKNDKDIEMIVKDTLKIVDSILIYHKNISIKK
jgi:hypothetical protein